MAKRSFGFPSFTANAVADTTGFTSGQYMAITNTTAVASLNVIEIYISGQAAASTVCVPVFARTSTLGITAFSITTGGSDGPLNSFTQAVASAANTYTHGAGGEPQRSSSQTLARLVLGMNAFGGIVRWVAAPGEEWGITGVTVSQSETALSNTSLGGSTAIIGAHIIYENL